MNLLIEFFRGDYFEYRFRLLDEDDTSIRLSENDNLILTVKKHITNNNYVIQKRLSDGIEWDESSQCYVVYFNHTDTNTLVAADYDFDIVIVWEGTKPETHKGKIKLMQDVTRNEVSGDG